MKKAERLNQELIFLRDKPHFQLKELMTAFNISKRTALRDVVELEAMGMPIYSETGKYGGYRSLRQSLLTPIYFNLEEIQAIFFALSAQDSLTSSPFDNKNFLQIREKMLASLPQSQQENINEMLEVVKFYGVEPVRATENLRLIMHSILEEKVLQLNYHQYGEEHLKLQFLELFYRDGIWFSSAYEVEQKCWGTYRCDEMSEIELADDGEQSYHLWELQSFQEDYEKHFHDIAFRCLLTPFGREIFLRHHYPNMRLTKEGERSYLVGAYNIKELDYMLHYLSGYGKHLIVIEPEELRLAYLEHLAEMLANNH